MSEFQIQQIVRRKSTGELLITQKHYPATENYPAGYRCSPLNSLSTMGYPLDDLEPAPPRKPGVFDYEIDFVPRANGLLEWESVEPLRLDITLSNIAACAGWVAYPDIAWVRKPGNAYKDWARIFLHTSQFGGYTGQASALVYERGANNPPQRLRDAVVDAAVKATHNPKEPVGNLAAAVLEMEAAPWKEKECTLPSAWLLSICKHEIVDSSTSESRVRGWTPRRCSKCGIDLSVDSSD
jgi:hypothetical protein